jgi:hypothetical protein
LQFDAKMVFWLRGEDVEEEVVYVDCWMACIVTLQLSKTKIEQPFEVGFPVWVSRPIDMGCPSN